MVFKSPDQWEIMGWFVLVTAGQEKNTECVCVRHERGVVKKAVETENISSKQSK